MREIYDKGFDLLDRRARRRFVLLAGVMVAVALAELIGISSVLMLLGILSDPERITALPLLAGIHDRLGFAEPFHFQIALTLVVIVVVAAGIAVKAAGIYAVIRYSQSCGAAISCRLLGAYLHFPYAWFLQRNTSDIARNVLQETNRLVGQVIDPALRLLGSVILALAIVGFLIMVDPVAALTAALAVGGLYGAIFVALRRRMLALGEKSLAANSARFRLAQEAAGGLKELKLMGLEESYVDRFRGPAHRMARYTAAANVLGELPRYVLEAVAFAAMLGMVLLVMLRSGGDLAAAIPTLGTFAFAAMRLLPALQQIYQNLAKIRNSKPVLDSIHADYRNALDAVADRPAPAAAGDRLPLRRALEIRDLHYGYPQAERPALAGLSMSIPARGTIGIVGGTGAGKTTLVDLLLGLLTPEGGEIRVDGVALERETVRAWQQSVGYVPQAIYLTDASVAANIAFGVPPERIDMAAVERAARIAALHDFVLGELAHGYETVVGERGVRLSGGQRQRVGIARALYHDPTLLVMDEATSALDNITERLVMEAVQRMRGDRTIILIAHRLSTVRNCDAIYLLERGRIAAVGTYDQLLAESETFQKMAANG